MNIGINTCYELYMYNFVLIIYTRLIWFFLQILPLLQRLCGTGKHTLSDLGLLQCP